jgi:hypothetical protein
VYENPLEFFSQSRNFQFTPRDGSAVIKHDPASRNGAHAAAAGEEPALPRMPR